MKQLCLLRHAEADWPQGEEHDIDRSLTVAGQADARAMGPRLRAAWQTPDRVLCSPSLRTRTTAQLVLRALPEAPRPTIDNRIYDASLARLLAVLAEVPDHCKRVLLVGHNPGLSELAGYLGDGSEVGLAPCDLLGFEFAVSGWPEMMACRDTPPFLRLPGRLSA